MTESHQSEIELEKKIVDDKMHIDTPTTEEDKNVASRGADLKNTFQSFTVSETSTSESAALNSAEELKKEAVHYFYF